MNPLTQTRNQMKLNERELEMGLAGTKNSWHQEYKDSAWVFMGGLPFQLTEGDVICMFSQYGEVVHINLIRDHTSGKSKGFGFLCYEDQRSTILAVDNLNGFKLLNRMIRVDHIHQYKLPKDLEKLDQDKKKLFMEGVAPKLISESDSSSQEEIVEEEKSRKKKHKKDKKKHKKKKKKKDNEKSRAESLESLPEKTSNCQYRNGHAAADKDDDSHSNEKKHSGHRAHGGQSARPITSPSFHERQSEEGRDRARRPPPPPVRRRFSRSRSRDSEDDHDRKRDRSRSRERRRHR